MFGDRLKELRIEKELTQGELGKLLNKTKNNISQYETNKREPDIETLNKLADLFNVTIDYLLGRTNHKTGFIQNENIDGHEYELELDKNIYPNGLTKEEIIERLEKLRQIELTLNPDNKENKS